MFKRFKERKRPLTDLALQETNLKKYQKNPHYKTFIELKKRKREVSERLFNLKDKLTNRTKH